MLKRFFLALCLTAGLFSPALGAGSISLSLSQQFDTLGKPLNGGLLYTYAAGTTTPQSAYQDSGLTIPWPNPITLDSAGRVPQLFFADGSIKVRLTNSAGVVQLAADGILVIGASSGGGGGSPVDATTILATGDFKVRHGTGALTGFVRANGRTIGSATSGATERANSDCQPLFEYLWNADANLTVSTGRGASANADWVANKTIALPDYRGRAIAGLVDMGNSAATTLTAAVFGTDPTVLGAAGGSQTTTMARTDLPNVALSLSGTLSVLSNRSDVIVGNMITINPSGGGSNVRAVSDSTGSPGNVQITSTGSLSTNCPGCGTSSLNSGVAQTAMSTVSPMKLSTIYIKL